MSKILKMESLPSNQKNKYMATKRKPIPGPKLLWQAGNAECEIVLTMRVVFPLERTAQLLHRYLTETEIKTLFEGKDTTRFTLEFIRDKLQAIHLFVPNFFDLGTQLDNPELEEQLMSMVPTIIAEFKKRKTKVKNDL